MPLSLAGTGAFATPDQLVTAPNKGPVTPKVPSAMKPPTIKAPKK